MVSRWPFVVVLVLAVFGGWIAFDWFQAREASLSEMPPRSDQAATLQPRDSIVLLNLAVGYPALEDALNSVAAKLAGDASGSEDIKCVSSDFPRFRECLTVNWSVRYAANGRVEVSRDGDKIKVTVPARFDGKAGFGGDVAKLLSLSGKNFDGSFTVSASASLSLDADFCPVVAPGETSFGWQNEGRVELVGRSSFKIFGSGFDVGPWNLDVGRHFNGQIRDALRGALANAGSALPCDEVRGELRKGWRNYSIPIEVKGSPPLFVNVEPTAFGTSEMLVEDGRVRLVARMAAKAVVATEKGSEEPKAELPPNEAVPTGPGKVELAVPLKLSYAELQTAAMKLLGKGPLIVPTPTGDVATSVHGVEVYPSGDRLAVGVRFSAHLPWHLSDANGTIWTSAKPVVEAGGKVVRLENVVVTRQIDNALWDVLTVALKDVIDAQVEKAARIDLAPAIPKIAAAVQAAVADPKKTGGVRIRVTNTDAGLGRVVVEQKVLSVEAVVTAEWDVVLDEIRL